MPETVPKSFDPAIVSSSTLFTSAAAKAKAAVLPLDPLTALSATTPQTLSHPSYGVAFLGAATATANVSHLAAVSDGNPGAQMTSQSQTKAKPPPLPPKDDEKEVALRKFVDASGHFSLVRNFRLADAFTIMNAFCAGQSIFNSARYLVTGDTRHAWYALWYPFFGAIFDLLDGKIARWCGGGSMLGQELDSLADSISFGAAPCVAAYTLGLREPLDTLILTLFICAGVARLARFNVTTALIPHDQTGKAKYFEGLPIPTSLILVGGMALCLLFGKFEGAESVRMAGGALQFTNRLVGGISSSASVNTGVLSGYRYGVPFGKGSLSLKQLAAVLGLKLSGTTVETFTAEFHYISLLWLGWAVAMVSKTLRVPKL